MNPGSAASTALCPVCDIPLRFAFKKGRFEYGRCPECGTVGTHPPPTDEELADHYAKAENYKVLKKYEESYAATYRRTARIVKDAAKRKMGVEGLENISALDVGCNIGGFVKALLELGADACGLDPYVNPDDISCEELKKRISRDESDYGGQADFLTMLGVIEHLRYPAAALAESRERIKDNGMIFIQTPDSESAVAKIMGRRFFAYQPVEHIYIFSRRGLIKALERAGFVEIEASRQWKFLSASYVYEQLGTWGRGFQWLLWPLRKIVPGLSLPLYGGGMTVCAKKNSCPKATEKAE
ncbi:MAG TPA: class I SAM-dependent methyltransferase [bacterium]|nr:MAG: bifunctional 3-demethylubiquinone-9 3-methyltransferase/ 2-octaprenyl-6-hydroxy phenol methylase [bacterium ADurb.Bin236]HOY62456.1 class I SAM-dependent methyltransferase [bacterium]HPI77122.1 class I SAM-dependent methyltransferase [bacterium]HPN95523.1 class I SAM-dependent methyltransferase [bacterium]